MMTKHGLSTIQLATIQQILAPFAKQIERVGLFGSRATGSYRANSDIDLVLYGSLDENTVDRIATLFTESSLAITVDIQAYHLITNPLLKFHIDAVMLPLFP